MADASLRSKDPGSEGRGPLLAEHPSAKHGPKKARGVRTMAKPTGKEVSVAYPMGVADPASGPVADPRTRRIAYRLSAVVAALMVVASAAGLFVDGLYRDGPWAREALRGGDLTTLLLAAPILAWSLVLSIRGSRPAQAVWIGALAYAIYNYAYYVFGAAFNDAFLLHVALLSLSIWAMALAVASLDLGAVAAAFRVGRAARWIGGFLALVGAILGGLWVFLAIRFAVTGELMADIPADGIHLVFAIDLSLLIPALVVAGVLLWRGSRSAVVFGVVMTVMGALYQVNLLVAGVFQANADVAGAKAFPLEGIIVATGFVVASAVLFAGAIASGRSEGWNGHS
jgi:hypothetical protein